ETIDYDGLFVLVQIVHWCIIWRQAFEFSWVGILAFSLWKKHTREVASVCSFDYCFIFPRSCQLREWCQKLPAL
ncbi:hypothetical protein HMPREF0322_00633, partial [Desulfitobacterium hafniense DP7]